MSPDTILAVENIIEFCHKKWAEADAHPVSDWPNPDMLTGRKMGYNDVLQYARKLLEKKT